MNEHDNKDARTDQDTARLVDCGLACCSRHGIDPALEFMQQAGVPRAVALRVLCSPQHFRQRDRRRQPRPQRGG